MSGIMLITSAQQKREANAGYTTLAGKYQNVAQVEPVSGYIVRQAGEPLFGYAQNKAATLRAREAAAITQVHERVTVTPGLKDAMRELHRAGAWPGSAENLPRTIRLDATETRLELRPNRNWSEPILAATWKQVQSVHLRQSSSDTGSVPGLDVTLSSKGQSITLPITLSPQGHPESSSHLPVNRGTVGSKLLSLQARNSPANP
jgi:hypothetical protein